MGMTIEEAIKYYENKNVVLTEEEALANTIALNTMRKYQKIEEIVKEWSESGLLQDKFYDLINEVLEDGKID